MFQRKKEAHLPGWLWFFLILPAFLGVALLWRRRELLRRIRFARRRVASPDIPLEMVPEGGAKAADFEVQIEESAPIRAAEAVTPVEPDDLKVIEGIGPTISGLLRDNGILSFRQLADAPLDQLNEILTRANLRRLADPGTWPEQARLAAAGQWTELEAFQRTLKAGRRKKEV